jgi:hypothetical protein
VEETGVPGENHWPVASHWQTLSHNVAHIEDTQTCFVTLNEVLKCVISLEQDHMQYRKNKQRNTVIGSVWVL